MLNNINEHDTSFLDCKHKHMIKSKLHLIKSESCTVCYLKKFHGFTNLIISKGYHSLVPGLNSIFLETVWVPLTNIVL